MALITLYWGPNGSAGLTHSLNSVSGESLSTWASSSSSTRSNNRNRIMEALKKHEAKSLPEEGETDRQMTMAGR
jgi:hypothetical protein